MRISALFMLMLGARFVSAQSPTPLACTEVVAPSDSGSGRFGEVAEGQYGRLAWTDGRPGQFLLRDDRGLVRVVGRTGAGPGEFDRPAGFVWKADTIMVSDWRLRRVQVFSDTGRLIRTMTALVPGVWAAQSDGRLVTIRSMALSDESSRPFVLVSQRPEDLSLDTVARFANPAGERFERRVGKTVVRNHQPFAMIPMAVGASDGSRFCGVSPTVGGTLLRCTDSSGRELVNRRLTLAPRPLTDAVYDSTIRVFLVGGSLEADLRARIKRPQALPPVLGIMINRTGEVWLQRSHRVEPISVWLRLRPDGSVRDEVALQRRYRLIRLDGDAVWAATADSDGLETLHKCRIGG